MGIFKDLQETIEKNSNSFKKDTVQEATKEYKSWDLQTNNERLDSIANYQSFLINSAIRKAKEEKKEHFLDNGKTQAELDKSIPYNGETGLAYTNLDNILMRSKMELENFKEPIFLTMNQANKLGGKLKTTGKTTKNGKTEYVEGIKIAQLRTSEFIPELKNGKKVLEPALDKDGKEKFTKEGKPVMQVKGEWKELKEPMYETYSLYNIEQFEGIDRSKIKPLNTKALQEKRESIVKNEKITFKLGRIAKGLDGRAKTGKLTIENMYEFCKATQTGRDFTPKSLIKPNLQAVKEYKNEGQSR